jgi:multidrug efflux system outer membrane protein
MRPRVLLAALTPLALAACMANPAPDIAVPTPPLPPAFFFTPDSGAQTSLAALMPQDDPAYRTLSEAALSAAPSLAEAAARIDAARAGARRAGAERARGCEQVSTVAQAVAERILVGKRAVLRRRDGQ